LMVFNVTFNNISAISWRSVLLVVCTNVSGENHRPVGSHWQTLYLVTLINIGETIRWNLFPTFMDRKLG
jgi:hypothetical protein